MNNVDVNKKYLTEEQLDEIKHCQELIRDINDNIDKLCDSEKDDIVYGYQLGKISEFLSDCHYKLHTTTIDINKQDIEKQYDSE